MKVTLSNIAMGYLYLSIIFTETYIFVSWLQTITLLNYFLIFIYLLLIRKKTEVDKKIKKIKKVLFIFIFYILFVNLYQNTLQKALSIFITTLPIPFLLEIFSVIKEKEKVLFKFIKFFLVFNLIFSLLQMGGIFITSNSLIAQIPFFGTDRGFVGFSSQGLRISGAGSSTIGLALMLGLIFLIVFFYRKSVYLTYKEKKLFFVLLIILIFLTQTRSLILSLPLVIIVTNLFLSKNIIKGILISLLISISISLAFYFSLPILKELFPRLFLSADVDTSIVHRIQANVYGVIGTYELSPWIGIPFKDALKAIEVGYNKLGLFIGNYFIDEVTYHNQLAFFFRIYGFIGLFLYLYLIFSLLKVSFSLKHEIYRKIVFSIVLYYFLYTLSHNNKWTMDYYLWVILGIFIGLGGKDEKNQNRI